MIGSLIQSNKLISMFDVVRFTTSVLSDRFSLDLVRGLDDYRIILTHGVMGELINVIENNYYGLDKNKLIFLCNNLEILKFCHQHNLNAYLISEYIFSDDDLYDIINVSKTYDCIFPGREAKAIGLFNREYNVNLLKCYNQSYFPMPRLDMPFYFNSSKCGLMTTETEGSCLSVGEMLLCGIPIVSVNIPKLDKDNYYPYNNHSYKNTYGIVFPNTLGGRELWLDNSNSLYCDRNDDSIEEAINTIINIDFDKYKIRNDFLAKLQMQRLQFMYLLKSILDELDIIDVDMNSFINLPYGNSTINSTQWNNIKLIYG